MSRLNKFLTIICCKWYVNCTTSLPTFYYALNSKREISVKTLRRLEKTAVKVRKKELDCLFWESCLHLQLCLDFLKFNLPKLKPYENFNKWYKAAVQKSLEVAKGDRKKEKGKLQTLQSTVYSTLSFLEKQKLIHLVKKRCKTYEEEITTIHDSKLLNMWIRQRPRSPDCITNLSNKELTVEEKNVLYRGLNHHILPKKLRSHDLKVAIEKICNPNKDNVNTLDRVYLPSSLKDEIKSVTRNFLNSAKHICSSKTNQNFHRTMNNLAKDRNIAIVKYDKGNGVCILPREMYLSKLDDIVHDSTKFVEVPPSKRKNARHPLFRNEIKTELKDCLTVAERRRITPSGCAIGKMYGTCKVHKKDYPIRPIVSMIQTPEYELAKYLDKIIKPYLPSKHSISSNKEFLDKIRKVKHQEQDYCISFDAVSLFTNVPLNETITWIANRMFDSQQATKPPMEKASLVKLLKIATGGMFSHRDKVFQQCDGVAMGNPLAPTLANFFLGELEYELFDQSNVDTDYPTFYTRYVDDIFCIFNKNSKFEAFLSKLNLLHPNLRFTHEYGGNNMPFLDTRIELSANGPESTIYRKPTNTNVVMHYDSVAPTAWKTGLVKWFLHRADTVCSNKTALNAEIENLKNIFLQNGYPNEVIVRIKNQLGKKDQQSESSSASDKSEATHESDETKRTSVFKIPYLGKISEVFGRKIKKLIKSPNHDTRVVYQTTKVKDAFQLKDRVPMELQSRVVYEFTCPGDPDVRYIGHTNRNFRDRYLEHVRGGSAISDHIAACQECNNKGVTMNDFAILKKCRHKNDTPKFESLLIKERDPILNRQLVKPGHKQYTLAVFD